MTEQAVSNQAWIELLHAEVCWHLARSGVDALVIKGPSNAQWLYPEGRESADVDVLIRPAHWDRALEVVHTLGFRDTLEQFKEWEPPEHSLTLSRSSPEVGRHAIDLHRYFPGIDADPAAAFQVLWDRRVGSRQGDTEVWFPDLAARALIIALHAAREPQSSKTAEDLRRAWTALDDNQRRELAALADQLQAQSALRAGLETEPATTPAVTELGMSDVTVSPHWALLSHGANGTAIHLQDVGALPWPKRPQAVWHWLFPSPALMRTRNPQASHGKAALGRAYATRISDGLRGLPDAIAALRSAKHREGK